MAARIPKRVGPAQLSNAAATLYTAPNPSSLPTGMVAKSFVRVVHLSNPDTSTHTVTLSITADAAAKRIYDAYSMAAGTTKDDTDGYWLEAGEVLQGFADSASKVVYEFTVDEIIFGG